MNLQFHDMLYSGRLRTELFEGHEVQQLILITIEVLCKTGWWFYLVTNSRVQIPQNQNSRTTDGTPDYQFV